MFLFVICRRILYISIRVIGIVIESGIYGRRLVNCLKTLKVSLLNIK